MDIVYLERPNVCEVLQGHIKSYRKTHPRLTGAQIARRIGVSTSTLNRIELGDIKTPTIDQAVKILRACTSPDQVAEFMRTYYPDIHHGLLEYFKMTSERQELSEDIEEYFCDESTYMMMLFATTSAGLSENWVLQEYGRSGHQKFMKLASRGVFVNKDGRFYASERDVNLSPETCIKTLSLMSEVASNEAKIYGTPKNTFWDINYNNVNYKKIENELNQILDNCKIELNHLLNKPENKGSDLLYSGMLVRLVRERV